MKQCNQCKSPFEITDKDQKLYEKFGAKPTGLCFECDQKNRLCFRNERILYKRKCDFTGGDIISIYSPDKPYKIYKNDIWYSDKWNALDFGKDFDFKRPFFEQLQELQLKVPRLPLVNVNSENSEYCNMCIGNKDSYLVFGGDFNDSVLYGTLCMSNKDCVDIDLSNNNELCYMLGDSINCYGCHFAFDSKNCRNCFFISDCSNCSECILCANLANKSFCINNIQYPKGEYLQKKKEFLNGSYNTQISLFRAFNDMRKSRIVKYSHTLSCQNCTGDYLKNSKNCHNCYDVSDSEDLKDVIFANKAKDCFNCGLVGYSSERIYNSIAICSVHGIKNSYYIFASSSIEYCEQMLNSHSCFGCIGLDHKENCILNKQYSKQDYDGLKDRIISYMKKTGEWGQFFPKTFSCFGYNESTADQYYPLSKEQALSQGYKWKEEGAKDYVPQNYNIPDNIADVKSDITDANLVCSECKKNLKIIPQELKFYKSNYIPIPRQCSECRHSIRLSLRNPRKLWDRKCSKCGAGIHTTYSPDRPEKVYCETCYLKEVY